VTKTHSRPYTSTDNPYSEAHFKTLKYRPTFPQRFQNIEQARAHCRELFDWYNHQHRHSGIGLMTPAAVHYGDATELHTQRALAAGSRRSGTSLMLSESSGESPLQVLWPN
jgi:putative transposase